MVSQLPSQGKSNSERVRRLDNRRTSARKVIEAYKKGSLTCNEVIIIFPALSTQAKEQVKNEVYAKQKKFWNSAEQAKYYSEIHPQLPPVPLHFRDFVSKTEPKNQETIVELGCSCGTLMQKLLKENGNIKFIGIDYAPRLMRKIPEITPQMDDDQVRLINHDLRKGIPLSDNSQAKVISNWGITNLFPQELQEIFYEVKRILMPQGKFVCSGLVAKEKLSFGSFFKRALYKPQIIVKMVQKYSEGIIQQAEEFGTELRQICPVYSPNQLIQMIESAGLRVQEKNFTLMGKSVTITAVNHKESKGYP